VLAPQAEQAIREAKFQALVFTNTITPLPIEPERLGAPVAILDSAPLIADAIHQLRDEAALAANRV
jgi:phosphoribosylpyrophosphate synthetase